MKLKYDVKGVDPGGAALPKPGVYTCKVTSCVFNETPGENPDGSKKNPRLEVQYQITEGESKGFTLYDYIPLIESMDWKMAQFVRAMGLPPKGTITDDVVGTALSVRVAIQPANDQYDASARPRTLLPLDGDEGEDLDADDDDPDADPDDGDDEDDEPWTEEALDELEKKELKEVAEEFDVDFPTRLTAKGKSKVIAAILEAQDSDDDDDSDDDSDDEDELTWEQLEEMDADELSEVIEENELEVELKTKKKVKGKTKTVTRDLDEVRAEIAEELEIEVDDDDDSDDDSDDEDTPDYESMDLGALKKLAKERDLSTAGTKKALIKRLEKDDEPF